MSLKDRKSRLLAAYHDGELSPFGRWRVQRWLARDAVARQELGELASLGGLLREVEAEAPAPDLWDAIRLRLPALDARRAEAAAKLERPVWLPRFVGAAVAATAVALAVGIGLNLGGVREGGAVRWLDSRGSPVLVQDGGDATLIWLLEASPETLSRRTGRARNLG